MFQPIHEKVAVVGVYNHAQFAPRKFLWNKKRYLVDQVTLISDVIDGGVKKRVYSLVSAGNVYRLVFDRMSEVWMLEEVWYE